MKKLLAILLFTLISVPANGVELIVKELRISPVTKNQCVSNGREFASGELIVELTGKSKQINLALHNKFDALIRPLFDNWYHLTFYTGCKGTLRAYEEVKKIEGVKRVEYNYIMRAMHK